MILHSSKVQALWPISSTTSLHTVSTPNPDEVFYIDVHIDPVTNKGFVLWEDIKLAFDDALHVQRQGNMVPFLEGADSQPLRPYRLPALLGEVLEVVVSGEFVDTEATLLQKETQLEETMEETPAIATVNVTRRNPAYGLENTAMDNYSHMDIPVALTTVYHMASQTTAQHALNTNNTHLNAAANGGAATGRNPAYGLEDEAMDGYRNNDNPAFRPASRAPQLYESDQPAAEIQRSDNTKLLRAPQKYMESVIATTLTEHYIQTMIDARLGEVGAQVALGDMYRDGKGVQQDYQTAMDWYLLAEEQGNLNACSRLGDLYRDGLGVEVDKVVAKSWYQKAADQGLESAQYNLNCLTLNFKGVHTNIYDELKWLQKAANDGVLGAERKLRLAMDRIDDFALERV